MIFSWIRRRRRRQVLSVPFPALWSDVLNKNVHHYRRLDERQQAKVRRDIQIFAAEKNWEGCGGLEMNDEIVVTIAGQMAILVLGFDEQYFDAVKTVLVYPDAYVAKGTAISQSGLTVYGDSAREGEAWYGGPVILSWADVLSNAQRPGQHNLVLHEFAHQLDMLNGEDADGIPPIESRDFAEQWISVCKREYERLCHDCQHRHRTVFDCYGATSAAEFFAVATEAFFESPVPFAHNHSELFDLFQQYYQVDPLVFAFNDHGSDAVHQRLT